jgi:hypothetical protein
MLAVANQQRAAEPSRRWQARELEFNEFEVVRAARDPCLRDRKPTFSLQKNDRIHADDWKPP